MNELINYAPNITALSIPRQSEAIFFANVNQILTGIIKYPLSFRQKMLCFCKIISIEQVCCLAKAKYKGIKFRFTPRPTFGYFFEKKLCQHVSIILCEVGNDDICPRPVQTEQGFRHSRFIIQPAIPASG